MITARRIIHSYTTHGGIQDAAQNIREILDFSININPFPPPRSVREAVNDVRIECYPNIRPRGLVQELAKLTGLNTDELLVCNGTSEAILLISLVFLMEGDAVIQFTPCYGEYAKTSSFMGAQVVEIPMDVKSPSIDGAAVSELLKKTKARICWLCNPASPSGRALSLKEVEELAQLCTRHECILVIDEAYANFLSNRLHTETLIADNHIILLRSMTKDYNLNALRLGYIAGQGEIVQSIETAQVPWSVNLLAERAGIAALQEQAYYTKTWQKTLLYRRKLQEDIADLGYCVLPSDANYFLFYDHVGNLVNALQENGIYVRDCLSFGLKQYIRIGTSSEDNNMRLIDTLREITPKMIDEQQENNL